MPREIITMQCGDCKERNYSTTKNRKTTPDRIEMKKVTTPSLKEVQATTMVVVITVFIFGVYFWLVDFLIGRGIDFLFRSLGHS